MAKAENGLGARRRDAGARTLRRSIPASGVCAAPPVSAALRSGGAAAVLVLLLISGVAGCGAGTSGGDAGESGVAERSDSVATPDPSDTAAGDAEVGGMPPDHLAGVVAGSEWTAGETSAERPTDGAALLRSIRTARHEGFDRIVLDFAGDAVPGYHVAQIDRPVRQCGSGDVVEMAAEGWLSITVPPAHAHTEDGVATATPRNRELELPALRELRVVCDFEGMVEVVAGVAAPERYRVFVLEEPNRLVVDIRH